ncbi:MAG: DeoR/GlpR family DNA-binding transcription regulator [Clostridia bacterium]|nr:DeoR/GlpR family DNA-binding transcription regulator [Clostridia bacterium]
MKSDRKKAILSFIQQEGQVRLNRLRDVFPEVSEMTLRRDLDALEEENLVLRTHGGAKALPATSTANRPLPLAAGFTSSTSIARGALGFLEEDRSVYLDGGSDLLPFIDSMPDIRLFAITNAPHIAIELMKKQHAEVILLGGSMNRSTMLSTGPSATNMVDLLNIDIAFMTAAGFSVESGFTYPYFNESELKRKIIKTAKKVIMLLDSTKFNRVLPFSFAALEDVDVIITDKKLPDEIMNEASKHGVKVVW